VYFLKLLISLLLFPRRYPRWLSPILALLLITGCGGERQQRRHQPQPHRKADLTVTVQLDRRLGGRHSASGFLHALGPGRPPDRLVAPLRPRLWRGDLRRASLARAVRLGARYELVLSDLWGYRKDHWNGRGPPWEHLREWEKLVRLAAGPLRGRRVLFDVWNEPDDRGYFGGGLQRYIRVYLAARRAIERELGPGAEVGGPSTSHYLPLWSEALALCCRPHFLSWHATDPALTPAAISRQLRDLKRRLGARHALQINEFGSPAGRYQPGKTVGYLAAIEGGGADAAARACWSPLECGPASLDGLLTPAGEPRAVWWAQRWYALTPPDGRVGTEVSDGRLSTLASRGSPSRVMLGRVERGSGRALDVAVALRGLAGSNVHVRIERLPDSGPAALPRPERIADEDLHVDHGAARAFVPGLRPHEAALVTVDPG
jgi:xylan 1,4-beta-xylosidase